MLCVAPLCLAIAALVDPMPCVYERGLASTAWVRAEGEAAGTGFLVDAEKRWLVTCRHVVGDRKIVEVFFPWHRDGELVVDRQAYLSNRETLRKLGLLVSGTVLRTSDATDMALVELPTVPPRVKQVMFPPVTNSRRTLPSERLLAIGHRQDLDSLWNCTTGRVRQTYVLTEGYSWRAQKLSVKASVVVAQLPIEEGDSGGPVFNREGELVGMVAALRRACPEAAIVIEEQEISMFLREVKRDKADLESNTNPIDITKLPLPYRRLIQTTVWVRPKSTDYHTAAVLLQTDGYEFLYLTNARGLGPGDRCCVSIPDRDDARWCGDRKKALDPVTGRWRSAIVLARDPRRDLALIKLADPQADDVVEGLAFARKAPQPGEAVHAMSHPAGLEFAWMYASGCLRQRGRLSHGPSDEPADRVETLILQLPSQGRSPGGPVINDQGELVGILAAREGALGQVGYAISAAEIAIFLDSARPVGKPRTWDGFLSRVIRGVRDWQQQTVETLVDEGVDYLYQNQIVQATERFDQALTVDPHSPSAAVERAHLYVEENRPAAAETLLDRLIHRGCREDELLELRVKLARESKNLRLARNFAEMRAESVPGGEAYQSLASILFALGEEEKAAVEYAHAVRTGLEFREMCGDLLAQVEQTLKINPDAHGRAADWIRKVFTEISERGEAPSLRMLCDKASAERDEKKRLKLYLDFIRLRIK